MPSIGPQSGTIFTNVNTGGTDWASVANGASSNDLYVTNSFLTAGDTDQYWVRGFDFSALTSIAVIDGMLVEVEGNLTGTAAISTANIRLIKSDTLHGGTRSTAPSWTGTDSYASWGGSTDIWDGTFTYADIGPVNSFGCSIAFAYTGSGSIRIDHVRITVYYTDVTGAPRSATATVSTNQSASATAATNQSASATAGTNQSASATAGTNQSSSSTVGTNQDADVNV